MKENAMQRLNRMVKERGPLVAGLDPDLNKAIRLYGYSIDQFRNEDDFYRTVIHTYCVDYIEHISPLVAAIKINSAFFEAIGMENDYWTIAEIAKGKGLFVIADVKRADIGNTSAQYAQAFLSEGSPFDAITVNPYFGTDGIKPFLDLAKQNGKGIFVLVKTSNPSSKEIQDAILQDGKPVYELVASFVKEWGDYTSDGDEDYNLVGAVVGATYPEQAKRLRDLMPKTFFLVPGYGAQGATAQDIAACFDAEGGGAIVNSSRGIMEAYKNWRWRREYSEGAKWYELSVKEAQRAQEELRSAILSYIKK